MQGETNPEVQFLLCVSVCVCGCLKARKPTLCTFVFWWFFLCEVYCTYSRKSTFYRLCSID